MLGLGFVGRVTKTRGGGLEVKKFRAEGKKQHCAMESGRAMGRKFNAKNLGGGK